MERLALETGLRVGYLIPTQVTEHLTFHSKTGSPRVLMSYAWTVITELQLKDDGDFIVSGNLSLVL